MARKILFLLLFLGLCLFCERVYALSFKESRMSIWSKDFLNFSGLEILGRSVDLSARSETGLPEVLGFLCPRIQFPVHRNSGGIVWSRIAFLPYRSHFSYSPPTRPSRVTVSFYSLIRRTCGPPPIIPHEDTIVDNAPEVFS